MISVRRLAAVSSEVTQFSIYLPIQEELTFKGLAPEQEVIYHASCHTEWTDVKKSKAPETYKQAIADMLST